MEIDVTHLVDEDCRQFSDSIHNSGLQNIGQVTWRNACEHAEDNPLVKAEDQDELRDWIREFGAWTDDDIKAMSDDETNALLLQFIASAIQEMEDYDSHEDYKIACENGECNGELYYGEETNGILTWFYNIGF